MEIDLMAFDETKENTNVNLANENVGSVQRNTEFDAMLTRAREALTHIGSQCPHELRREGPRAYSLRRQRGTTNTKP